jgi:uncharacterized protein YbcI
MTLLSSLWIDRSRRVASETSEQQPDPDSADSLTKRISRAHVRLFSEYTGRGPHRSRTTIDGDLVVCLLSGLLTKGERSLIASGKSEAVLEMRRSFQDAMRDDLVAEVEAATGRTVSAFLSANHLDPDHALEGYVLDGSPPR